MAKERIAITIDNNLLKLIDSKVGTELSSRSEAIEHFIRKGLFNNSSFSAVIMLKGEHHQKALADIHGKPLIAHQIKQLAGAGAQKIVLVTQESRMMKKLFAEINKSQIAIEVMTKNVSGTAQAIKAAQSDNPFFALSGDVFFDFNLAAMYEKHIAHGRAATMGLVSSSMPTSAGVAVLDGDYIIRFDEKPQKALSYIINAGIYVFSPSIFSSIGPKDVSLERDVFPKLATQKQLLGYFVPGMYKHVE